MSAAPAPLETWLSYPRLGIPIVPEHTPDPTTAAGCDCRRDDCRKPGKHPRTKNGSLDATTDEATITRWHGMWSQANLGTALEKASLVIIGPDSPAWAEEFKRRGLPPTAVARSGGGDGHLHYYYRRRPCCPQARICKPDEYDILSKGNAILPPSLHASGERYTWLIPIDSLDQLPYAPSWLCSELHPAGERRRSGETHSGGGGDDGPPLQLDDDGQQVWRGELPKLKPDGAVDRSGTLLKIGRVLYDAGATRRLLVAELADRDEQLGYRKYTDRPDADRQYRAIVDELERRGQTPRLELVTPPAPNGHANGVATTAPPEVGHDGAEGCLGCRARDDQLAQLASVVETQREIITTQRTELERLNRERYAEWRLRRSKMKSVQVDTFIALARIGTKRADWLDKDAPVITGQNISDELGAHESTARSNADAVCSLPGSPIKRVTKYRTDGMRGQLTTYEMAVRDPVELLERMVVVAEALDQSPSARPRPRRCPIHPNAGTKTVCAAAGCDVILSERPAPAAPAPGVRPLCEEVTRIGADTPPVDVLVLTPVQHPRIGGVGSSEPTPNGDGLDSEASPFDQRAAELVAIPIAAERADQDYGRWAPTLEERAPRLQLTTKAEAPSDAPPPDLSTLAALAERRGWAPLATRHGSVGGTAESWQRFLSLPPPWLPEALPAMLAGSEVAP